MDSGLCTKCKKFFGSTEGLCSQCLKESRSRKNTDEMISHVLDIVPQLIEEAKQLPVVDLNRCSACSKKLKPLNFKCKCGLVFCCHHRLPEEHNCTFDYKSVGVRKLSEENPLIQAQKFNKL